MEARPPGPGLEMDGNPQPDVAAQAQSFQRQHEHLVQAPAGPGQQVGDRGPQQDRSGEVAVHLLDGRVMPQDRIVLPQARPMDQFPGLMPVDQVGGDAGGLEGGIGGRPGVVRRQGGAERQPQAPGSAPGFQGRATSVLPRTDPATTMQRPPAPAGATGNLRFQKNKYLIFSVKPGTG